MIDVAKPRGETRAGDVLQRLREDILGCTLQPGEKLRFEALRDRYEVSFSTLREALSRQYDISAREPDIQVWNVDLRGDRALTLRHTQRNNLSLREDSQEVLKHVARLWGFDVHLESIDSQGRVAMRKTASSKTAR